MDQVIAESGTSKGAFFHHFDSKAALARALVDRYAAADGADELMAAQPSCLYVSVLTERQLASVGTWDQISRAVLAWRAELARLLDEALATRPGAIPVDTNALADHVFVTFEGAFILARSMNDAGHMRAQLRVLRQLLEALLEPRPAS